MISQDKKTFAENIRVLFEELKLAIEWDRPSILLAVCRSKSGQVKAENELKNKLQQLGFSVNKIEVNSQSPLVSRQILNLSNKDKIVFFISNIDWGGGLDGKDAYRNLNIEREAFVENRIKAVFWLTRTEALNLPSHAPDFWAFRHRVVEFDSPRTGEKIKLSVGVLIWPGQNVNEKPEKVTEMIDIYKRSMMELPDRPESLSSRLELLYTIGYLYWFLGDTPRALELLQSGIALAHSSELSMIRTWLLNGVAILYYERGRYKEAVAIYKDLIAKNQEDGNIRINFAITLCALGRNFNAISEGKKAVKLSMADANIWNCLGCIYMSAGKSDEAVPIFEKAIELAPTSPVFYESLAICYYTLGLAEESASQIRIASKYATAPTFFTQAYEYAILGMPEKSLSLLQAALASGQISMAEIRRNFHVQMLFGSSLLEGPAI